MLKPKMPNYKKNALEDAAKVVNTVIDDSSNNEDNRYEIRLIAFCMDNIEQEYDEIRFSPGTDIQRLLDINGINHRLVSLQNIVFKNEFPLLIAFSTEHNSPITVYKKKNKTYVYLPLEDKSEEISNLDSLSGT